MGTSGEGRAWELTYNTALRWRQRWADNKGGWVDIRVNRVNRNILKDSQKLYFWLRKQMKIFL